MQCISIMYSCTIPNSTQEQLVLIKLDITIDTVTDQI